MRTCSAPLLENVPKGSAIVSLSTVPAQRTKRVSNFNAGPATLPLPVLERIREELLDWRGSGMSVMEMSHRSPEFESINAHAEAGLRRHLAIPDEYAVIFLQGGGSMQFTMVPMNLCLPGKPVDLLHTGAWTAKALSELKKGILHKIAASTEADKFTRVPRNDEMRFSPEASYVHICTNNTIEGTQWRALPDTGSVPLVADMSSDIASRPVDVKKFGLVFAGAQKNLGPSGATIVIIRKDLAELADKNLPTILQYRTHIKEHSLYHTPPTFAIESSRSKMNVVFRVAKGDETVEKKFVQDAAAAGIVGIAGHRSIGGMRVSLYNAVTLETVETLVGFLRENQGTHG